MNKLFAILFCLFCYFHVTGQTNGAPLKPLTSQSEPLTNWQRKDSILQAKRIEEKRVKDSIRYALDSLQRIYVKAPDIDRPNRFIDSLKALSIVRNGDLFAWKEQFEPSNTNREEGIVKAHREVWVIGVIGVLLFFFAVLKFSFSSELKSMVHAFYSNRALVQISKEDNLYNSWPFILLYILFGFTLGMFIYLCNDYFEKRNIQNGPSLYLFFSITVVVLFTLKIIVLRFLGFLFDMQRLVRDYVSILYLSYFNTAILFLPLNLIIAFTSDAYNILIFYVSILLLVTIFSLQFLRASFSALKTYRFPKFYLFLYFCALEIGPILILFTLFGF